MAGTGERPLGWGGEEDGRESRDEFAEPSSGRIPGRLGGAALARRCVGKNHARLRVTRGRGQRLAMNLRGSEAASAPCSLSAGRGSRALPPRAPATAPPRPAPEGGAGSLPPLPPSRSSAACSACPTAFPPAPRVLPGATAGRPIRVRSLGGDGWSFARPLPSALPAPGRRCPLAAGEEGG